MEKLVGASEASKFMEALERVSPKSVRYNRKSYLPTQDELQSTGAAVPWCEPYGRYWEREILPSRTIEYTAGKYYIQEASAMLAISAASRVIDFNGKIVLDLTAAPGGKATQAAELIDHGYLVANEVIRKRVDGLIWNINRSRLNNVIVTSLSTDFLARSLPGFFDIVIVDAPCSGEGLFQKRKHSLDNWSEKNVRFCAGRQESILEGALQLLKPGGFIVYSTCTFSQEENENQVGFLLDRGLIPVPLPGDLPVSPAVSENENIRVCSRRIFPHIEGGAGAFVSVLQKEPGPVIPFQGKYDPYKTKKPEIKTSHIRTEELSGYFFEKGGILGYFSHECIPGVLLQNSFQTGAPILDKRRGDSFMFGCVQLASEEAVVEVEALDAEAYARGEDTQLNRPDGNYFLRFNGMILGPVKVTGARAVNQLPRSLSIKAGI